MVREPGSCYQDGAGNRGMRGVARLIASNFGWILAALWFNGSGATKQSEQIQRRVEASNS